MLGARCLRVTLATDASLTGWGAVMSDHPARRLWRGHHLSWHINRLEMLTVFQVLKDFFPDLRDHHVLVRTDNTAVVTYINHQGGLRSRPLCRLAHQILVWSQGKLFSLRAVYIPGHLNVGPDIMSRQGLWSGGIPKRGAQYTGTGKVPLYIIFQTVRYHNFAQFGISYAAVAKCTCGRQYFPNFCADGKM